MAQTYGDISWERMTRAVEKVRERLQRTVRILEAAGVPYAIAGGHAVAAWVSRVDEAAVRNTQDVDVLIRRDDLPAAISAMEADGFVYRHAAEIDMFLEGEGGRARDAVHLVFADEKVREAYESAAPGVDESDSSGDFTVLSLEALVRMKLTSFRDKDRTHLRDMIDVELIDATWPSRYPQSLGSRLQEILDNPEG